MEWSGTVLVGELSPPSCGDRERRLVERGLAVWRLTSGDIDHTTPHHASCSREQPTDIRYQVGTRQTYKVHCKGTITERQRHREEHNNSE